MSRTVLEDNQLRFLKDLETRLTIAERELLRTSGVAGQPPSGAAGGDLEGSFPAPTIKGSVGLTGLPTSTLPDVDSFTSRIATTQWFGNQRAVTAPPANGTASIGTSNRWATADHTHPNDTTILGSAIPLMNGSGSAGTALYASRQDHVHPTDTTRAPINSPTFTGVPRAPTPSASDDSTQLATTAYTRSLAGTATPLIDGAGSAGSSLYFSRSDHVHPSLAGSSVPLMNGAGAVGSSAYFSREDHVHPSDTSRVAKAGDTMTGTLSLTQGSDAVALAAYITGDAVSRFAVRTGGGLSWGDGTNARDVSIIRTATGTVTLTAASTIATGSFQAQGQLAAGQAATAQHGLVAASGGVLSLTGGGNAANETALLTFQNGRGRIGYNGDRTALVIAGMGPSANIPVEFHAGADTLSNGLKRAGRIDTSGRWIFGPYAGNTGGGDAAGTVQVGSVATVDAANGLAFYTDTFLHRDDVNSLYMPGNFSARIINLRAEPGGTASLGFGVYGGDLLSIQRVNAAANFTVPDNTWPGHSLMDHSVPFSKLESFLYGGGNRLYNSSFEAGTYVDADPAADATPFDGWNFTGPVTVPAGISTITPASASPDNGRIVYGTANNAVALKVVSNGSGTILIRPNAGRRPATQPGVKLALSFYGAANVSGRTARIRARFYDAANTEIAGSATVSSSFVLPSAGMQRYYLDADSGPTTPAGTVYSSMEVELDATASGQRFYLDGFQLESSVAASTYGPNPAEVLPGFIDATAIRASAIYGDAIAATLTVTGKVIQTDITPNKRVVMDGNTGEIAGYDAANIKRVMLKAGASGAQTTTYVPSFALYDYQGNQGLTVSDTGGLETSQTFPKVRMDSSGVYLYDNSGIQELAIHSASGKLVAGQNLTSPLRLELDRDSLRFYDSAGALGLYSSAGGLRTRTTTNRVELLPGGLFAYDALGVNTVALASDGSLTLQGSGRVKASMVDVRPGGANQLLNSTFQSGGLIAAQAASPAPTFLTNGFRGIYNAARIVATSGSAYLGNYGSVAANRIPITAGQPVTVSYWFRADSGTLNGRLRVYIYLYSGNTVGGTSTGAQYLGNVNGATIDGVTVANGHTDVAAQVGKWRRVYLTYTVPDTIVNPTTSVAEAPTHANFLCYYISGTANDTVSFAAMQFEEGDLPTSYGPKPDEIVPGTIIGDFLAATVSITGKTIQTSTTVGPKVALNGAGDTYPGLVGYNASGSVVTHLDASSGILNLYGEGRIKASSLDVRMGGGNKVYNSGFEAEPFTSGFTAQQGTASIVAPAATGDDANRVVSGSRAAKMVATTTGSVYLSQNVDRVMVVQPNTTYVASGYLESNVSGRALQIYVLWYSAAMANLGQTTTVSKTSTGLAMQRVVTTVTAPSNARFARLYVFGNAGAAGQAFYYDGFQFEEGEYPSSYGGVPGELLPGTIVGDYFAATVSMTSQTLQTAISGARVALLGASNELAIYDNTYKRVSLNTTDGLRFFNATTGDPGLSLSDTGGLQTALPGSARSVFDSNGVAIYDSSGARTMLLNPSGFNIAAATTSYNNGAFTPSRNVTWQALSGASQGKTEIGASYYPDPSVINPSHTASWNAYATTTGSNSNASLISAKTYGGTSDSDPTYAYLQLSSTKYVSSTTAHQSTFRLTGATSTKSVSVIGTTDNGTVGANSNITVQTYSSSPTTVLTSKVLLDSSGVSDFAFKDGSNVFPAANNVWTAFPFNTTYWGNYSISFGQCQYRKLGTRVEFRGLAKVVAAVSFGNVTYAIGTLPAAVRPTKQIVLYGGYNDTSLVRIDIRTDGVMYVVATAAGTSSGAAGAFLTLENLSYYTDNV